MCSVQEKQRVDRDHERHQVMMRKSIPANSHALGVSLTPAG